MLAGGEGRVVREGTGGGDLKDSAVLTFRMVMTNHDCLLNKLQETNL